MPVDQRDGADGGADGGEGHLTQADLARPSGEHDDGAADDGQHDERGAADQLTRAHPQWQRGGGGEGDQRADGGPDAHLGEVAQRRGQFAHAAGERQGRLGLAVGAVGQQLAHDNGGEDHAGQDGQAEGGVGSGRPTPRPVARMPSATAEAAMTGSSVKLPRASAARAVTSAVSP